VTQLVCEKSGAVPLPPVTYTYAGVTAGIVGTVSVDLSAMQVYLEALLLALVRSGLGPIVAVSAHGGNDASCIAAMECVFQRQPVGLLYCNVLGHAYRDLVAEVWGGPDANLAENCALWAAWDMQDRPGRPHPPEPSERAGKPEHLRRIAAAGHVPHTYHRPEQHIVIREEGTLAQGQRFLEKVADRIVAVLDDLRAYHDELSRR
jgi:creatinine amidohydrolase/Fe(II)-dependent formamide hydrolase-like protein